MLIKTLTSLVLAALVLALPALSPNLRGQITANVTILHSFSRTGAGGFAPEAASIQGSGGNFYGTTSYEGSGGYSTVFEITPTGVFNTLHIFSGTDGSVPLAALVQGIDGNFYGTTAYPNSDYTSYGTVFRITPSGVHTILHNFTGVDGGNPASNLIQYSDGNFYGTTQFNGTYGYGTIFKMTPTGVLNICTLLLVTATARVRRAILSWARMEIFTAQRVSTALLGTSLARFSRSRQPVSLR